MCGQSIETQKAFWDGRYQEEGRIWGDEPSKTAGMALAAFRRHYVESILVPGAGYGRNARLFSESGFNVDGVEISDAALQLAKVFDSKTTFHFGSALDMSFVDKNFDAVYGYNVMHLFRQADRQRFLEACWNKLKDGGFIFLTVFSEMEESFGRGGEVEPNTFESKPGRPVHYFTDDDLREHLRSFDIIETGVVADPEDHGDGPHTHTLRYILARKPRESVSE